MEDYQIVDLYWERDEKAISETDSKYGAFCHGVAMNVLSQNEDAEECVNDTYLQAWNSMPDQRPERLKAWLGRIVRNTAITRWRKNHAAKRYNGMTLLLGELEECIPSADTVERESDSAEIRSAVNSWLLTLDRDSRILFIRRYWNGESVKSLAELFDSTPERTEKKLYRLRLSLRKALEKEEIGL